MRSRPLGHAILEPDAAPIRPRDAASIIVWRNGPTGVEVLMGRRSRRAAFVPDFFVFPGGRLDDADFSIAPASPLNPAFVESMGVRGDAKKAAALAVAAVRETFEETGLMIADRANATGAAAWPEWSALGLAPALGQLRYFGRATTSPRSPIRFNARFFIAHAEHTRGELGGSGELSELMFYPVAIVMEGMPILDVTEFMLNELIRFANDASGVDRPPPIFCYRRTVPYVRYPGSRKASRQSAKELQSE
jgi:8-oxo-dGTP pyrophosphatase MutT (NUDIX family)